MIRRGRSVTSDVALTCDVVIMGSGAGGGPLAAELAMGGMSVVVLEKGAMVTAGDMTQDWASTWELFGGRRGLATSRDFGLNLSYAEALGGSTVHYWAMSFAPPAERVSRWNAEHGLGLDVERDLQPVVDRVMQNLSVHRTHDYLFNANNRLMRLGTERMRAHAGERRYAGENTPQAAKSCLGCGFREVGCAYNRKQSQLVSYLPIASRAGATILTDCDVREIIVEGGRAVGLRGVIRPLRDAGPAGPKVEVRATRAVVVAGNGLTTPELLLRAGLTNDNIGRHLVVNPNVFLWAEHPGPVNARRGPAESWWMTGFTEVRRDAGGRYVDGGWHAVPDSRDPASAAVLLAAAARDLRQPIGDFRHLLSAFSSIDDDNHPDNRVTLDANGDWQVDYRLRGDDGLKAKDFLRKVARVYLAAGAERVHVPVGGRVVEARADFAAAEREIDRVVDEIDTAPGGLAIAGAHLLSTARMGSAPATSVCGPDHEVHELPGLLVAGGAAVPTSVGRDPSITIMALSTLLARRLLRERGADLVPLRWERTRLNHTQIVDGPPAALGYDAEQRAVAAGREVLQ